MPEVLSCARGCGGSGGSAPERSEPRAWGCENRGWGAGGSFPKPPHGMGVLGWVIFAHTLHSGGIFLLRGRAVSRFLVGTERVCRGGTGRAGLHPGASASDGGPPGGCSQPLAGAGEPQVCLPARRPRCWGAAQPVPTSVPPALPGSAPLLGTVLVAARLGPSAWLSPATNPPVTSRHHRCGFWEGKLRQQGGKRQNSPLILTILILIIPRLTPGLFCLAERSPRGAKSRGEARVAWDRAWGSAGTGSHPCARGFGAAWLLLQLPPSPGAARGAVGWRGGDPGGGLVVARSHLRCCAPRHPVAMLGPAAPTTAPAPRGQPVACPRVPWVPPEDADGCAEV